MKSLLKILSGTSTRMPVTKNCPSCNCVVSVREVVCPSCGCVLRKHKQVEARRRTLKRACAASKVAVETADQASERRRRDRERVARTRAVETAGQASERRKYNRACIARKRVVETAHQSDERRRLDRECAARKRSVETPAETDLRQKRVKASKSVKSSTISLDTVTADFLAKTKEGPDFVCVSCHRLMYRQTVVRLNRDKYKKATDTLLKLVIGEKFLYASFNNAYYICKTCDCALSRGSMPIQSVANNLELTSVPPELSCLNRLETRLICLRVAFMTLVALPAGN